jgi:hypothetical protein
MRHLGPAAFVNRFWLRCSVSLADSGTDSASLTHRDETIPESPSEGSDTGGHLGHACSSCGQAEAIATGESVSFTVFTGVWACRRLWHPRC